MSEVVDISSSTSRTPETDLAATLACHAFVAQNTLGTISCTFFSAAKAEMPIEAIARKTTVDNNIILIRSPLFLAFYATVVFCFPCRTPGYLPFFVIGQHAGAGSFEV